MSSIAITQLNWADFAIAGIIILSAIISLIRGFVREAISLATWIVAAWVAIRFSPILSEILANHIHSHSLRVAVSFGSLFIIVLIIGALINYLFSQLVDKTGLNGTDRILGLFFGIARGILLIAVLILLGKAMQLQQDPWWQASQFIPQFHELVQWLQGFVPQQFNEIKQTLNT